MCSLCNPLTLKPYEVITHAILSARGGVGQVMEKSTEGRPYAQQLRGVSQAAYTAEHLSSRLERQGYKVLRASVTTSTRTSSKTRRIYSRGRYTCPVGTLVCCRNVSYSSQRELEEHIMSTHTEEVFKVWKYVSSPDRTQGWQGWGYLDRPMCSSPGLTRCLANLACVFGLRPPTRSGT